MQALSSLVAGYLETNEYEKQLSPDTIKAYRIDLRQFLDFTGDKWADKDMLNQYIKHLNQNFAPRSAKRKLASVRAFYHEMNLCGELAENPFDKLHIRIHSPQQLPRVIPEQIVHALLKSAYNAYTPGCREVLRDIVVLELLFSTGLRVSELCALSKDTFLLTESGRYSFLPAGTAPVSAAGPANYPQVPESNQWGYPCNASYVPSYICYFALRSRDGHTVHSISAGPQLDFHYADLYPCIC